MNIIEKEKTRQKMYLESLEIGMGDMIGEGVAIMDIRNHTQSLINLKEYMEEELKRFESLRKIGEKKITVETPENALELRRIIINIKELTKLIEAYND